MLFQRTKKKDDGYFLSLIIFSRNLHDMCDMCRTIIRTGL